MSTCTPWSARSRTALSVESYGPELNATITRSTSNWRTSSGSSAGVAEHREPLVVAALLRVVVDEADRVDPVLGVLEQLPADELPDRAGADDDAVLDERDAAPRDQPGERARDQDGDDRRRPERDQLRDLEIGGPGDAREHVEEPGAERGHVQHRRGVVGGGMVGALGVPAVEPVQVRDHQPAGQRRREQHQLGEVAVPALEQRVLGVGEARDGERDDEAEAVGRDQQPGQLPRPARGVCTVVALEDLERPRVDGSRVARVSSAPPFGPPRFGGRLPLPRGNAQRIASSRSWRLARSGA